MELDKIPQWFLALETEDAAFLKNFVLKSGSLKEIAKLYEVSYPTVRLRLDKLIQKIQLADQKKEEPFSAFIKGLAVDSRIDLETAKIIPLLLLVGTIWLFAGGILPLEQRYLFPFFILNSIFLGEWSAGRAKYQNQQQKEMQRMKAKDLS